MEKAPPGFHVKHAVLAGDGHVWSAKFHSPRVQFRERCLQVVADRRGAPGGHLDTECPVVHVLGYRGDAHRRHWSSGLGFAQSERAPFLIGRQQAHDAPTYGAVCRTNQDVAVARHDVCGEVPTKLPPYNLTRKRGAPGIGAARGSTQQCCPLDLGATAPMKHPDCAVWTRSEDCDHRSRRCTLDLRPRSGVLGVEQLAWCWVSRHRRGAIRQSQCAERLDGRCWGWCGPSDPRRTRRQTERRKEDEHQRSGHLELQLQ